MKYVFPPVAIFLAMTAHHFLWLNHTLLSGFDVVGAPLVPAV